GVQVGVAEQTRGMQDLRVGLGGQHIIGGEHPVEMGGHTQGEHGLGGAAGEPATPQGTFVGSVLFHALILYFPSCQKYSATRGEQGLVVAGLAVALVGDLGGQAVQLDEALGCGLVEGVAGVVGGQVEIVEGGTGTTAVDGDLACVQHEADIAGDVLLGGLDEGIQGALQRAEPETVVDLLGPAGVAAALVPGQLTLDGDILHGLVGGDEDDGTRCLVDLAGLDAHEAVLDHVETTDTLCATTAVELLDGLEHGDRTAVDGDGL